MRGEWYTTSGSSPGGGPIAACILALLLLGSGAAAAIATALVAVLIALAVAVVLAIAGGLAWLIIRARQDRPAVTYRAQVVPDRPPAIAPPAPRAPQLEAAHEVHLHLHGLDTDQIAAIARVIRMDATHELGRN